MFVGELISDDTDGIGHSNVVQNLIVVLESPRISKNITVVRILSDNFLGDSRCNFFSFAVADYPEELCHDVLDHAS